MTEGETAGTSGATGAIGATGAGAYAGAAGRRNMSCATRALGAEAAPKPVAITVTAMSACSPGFTTVPKMMFADDSLPTAS